MRALLVAVLPLLLTGCLFSRGDAPAPRFLEPLALPDVPAAPTPAGSGVRVRLGVVEAGAPSSTELLHHHADGEVVRDPTWRWSEPPVALWRRALRAAAEGAGVTLVDSPDAVAIGSTLVRFGILHDAAGGRAMSLVVEVTATRTDRRVQVVTIEKHAALGEELPGTLPDVAATLLREAGREAWDRVRAFATP